MIKVLIPLDGSDFSAAILSKVPSLFAPNTHTIILLRVLSMAEDVIGRAFEPLNTQPFDSQRWQDFVSSTELNQNEVHGAGVTLQALKKSLLEALVQTGGQLRVLGFEPEYQLQFGDPATTIVAVAKEVQVNLIAMASHGRSGLNRLLMGSVTLDVLRQSHLPVMVIRPHEDLAGQELERGLAYSLD